MSFITGNLTELAIAFFAIVSALFGAMKFGANRQASKDKSRRQAERLDTLDQVRENERESDEQSNADLIDRLSGGR